jgi:hypothetical protein
MKKFLLILALAAVCLPSLVSEAQAAPVKHHHAHGHAHHHAHHHHAEPKKA